MDSTCNHCKVRAASNGWLCPQCQWEHAKYLEQTFSGSGVESRHALKADARIPMLVKTSAGEVRGTDPEMGEAQASPLLIRGQSGNDREPKPDTVGGIPTAGVAPCLPETLSGQAQLPEARDEGAMDGSLAPTFLRGDHDDSEAASLQGRDYWQRLPRWCRRRLPHRWHFEQAKQHKPTDL